MPEEPSTVEPAEYPHSWLQDVANGVAHHYKEVLGRGPTIVRPYGLGADGVICVLEGTRSTAENALAEIGEHRRIRETRVLVQYAREQALRAAVEEASGRRVRTYVSGLNPHDDAAVDVFLFEPED